MNENGGNIVRKVGGVLQKSTNQYYAHATDGTITHAAGEQIGYKAENHIFDDYEAGKDDNFTNAIAGVAVFRRVEANYAIHPNYGFDWIAGENYGTSYPEPYNLQGYTLSGFNDIKAEHTPADLFAAIGKAYVKMGANSGHSKIQLNGKEYFVPWFCGFSKDAAGNAKSFVLDLFFNIAAPADGTIKIIARNENVAVSFVGTPDPYFEITTATQPLFKRQVELTFKGPVTEHTCIEVVFSPKTEPIPSTEPGVMDGIVVVPNQLMGVLNVYKNNFEYIMNVRYVKVFFKGPVLVKGQKNKVHLSGISKNYTYYTDPNSPGRSAIKRLERRKLALEAEEQRAISDPPGSFSLRRGLVSTQRELATVTAELLTANTDFSSEYAEAVRIDLLQEAKLNAYEPTMASYKPFYTDAFSQALIHYAEIRPTNYEKTEIELPELGGFFHDIMLQTSSAGYSLVRDDGKAPDTTAVRDEVMDAFRSSESADKKETIIFLLPFRLPSDNSGHILLGKAEDVSLRADAAMLTVDVQNPSYDGRSILIHEIGHTFDLSHTFVRRGGSWLFGGGIKVEQGTTDNIMDYGHNDLNNDADPSNNVVIVARKLTFWKFQWDRMHQDPNLLRREIT